MDKATLFQHLKSSNDANGNARRIFVFYDANGDVVHIEKERYNRPAACKGLIELANINIDTREYGAWLAMAVERGYES